MSAPLGHLPGSPAGHPEYHKILGELRDLHVLKSGGYGTGKDPFHNFTVVAAAKDQPGFVYPLDRSVEKATRCYSLIAQARFGELGEEFLDMASLMVCAEAIRRAQ